MFYKIVSRFVPSSELLLCASDSSSSDEPHSKDEGNKKIQKIHRQNGRPLFVAKLLGKIDSRGTPVPSLPGVPPSLRLLPNGRSFLQIPLP